MSRSCATRLYLQRLMYFFLIFCMLPLLTGCQEERTIVHDLGERDANEILDYLAGKGISASKIKSEGGGGGGGAAKETLWNISVPGKDAPMAMSLLTQAGLPRKPQANLLNIFGQNSLVPSQLSEQVRLQAGTDQQLASTIRKMDGVIDADVKISYPVEDPLHPEASRKQKITGSVYVKFSPLLKDPNIHLAPKIKRFISSSITGLDYENVDVILDPARFAELPRLGAMAPVEEKHFANIWSVIVAEESITRFRAIFFSFMVAILVLVLLLGWITWKLYPVMDQLGGFKALFGLAPIHLGPPKESAETPPSDEGGPPPPTPKSDEEGVT